MELVSIRTVRTSITRLAHAVARFKPVPSEEVAAFVLAAEREGVTAHEWPAVEQGLFDAASVRGVMPAPIALPEIVRGLRKAA